MPTSNSNYFSPLAPSREADLIRLIKPKAVNLISSEFYVEEYQSPPAHQAVSTGITLGDMSNVTLNATAISKEYTCPIAAGQGHITDIWLEVSAFNTTVGVAGTFSDWWPYLLINSFTMKQARNYVYQSYNPVYWFMYTISRLPRELRTKLFSLSNITTIPAGVAAPGTAVGTQVMVLPLPWSRIWSGGIAQPALDPDDFLAPGIQLIFKFNPISYFASSTITSMYLDIVARCQVVLYYQVKGQAAGMTSSNDPAGIEETFNVPFENIAYNETITGPTVGSTAGITTFTPAFNSCKFAYSSYFAKGIYLAAQLQTVATADPPQYFRGSFPNNFKYYPKGASTPAFEIDSVAGLRMFQIMQELKLEPYNSAEDIAPANAWVNNFAWFFGANNTPNDIYGGWAFNDTTSGSVSIGGTYPAAVWLTPCVIILQVVSVAYEGSFKTMKVSFGGMGDTGV